MANSPINWTSSDQKSCSSFYGEVFEIITNPPSTLWSGDSIERCFCSAKPTKKLLIRDLLEKL